MGGLYNAIFGVNEDAPALLVMLRLTPNDFSRFRDAFVANGEIIVYTRLGGGNREGYTHIFTAMKKHPQYLRDVDDNFDSTYCTFFFRIPKYLPEDVLEILKAMDIGEWKPDERWKVALHKVETDPKESERVAMNVDKHVKVVSTDGRKQTLSQFVAGLKSK